MSATVVNLFGGPGSGKSTTCAGIFHALKLKGINCEMALEYAKDKVWEKSFHTLDNQIYVFGKQHHRMFRLKDDVEVIITDSPLLLSIHYDKEKNENFKNLILEQFNKFNSINIYIGRGNIPYNPKGRYQDENGAKQIDGEIKVMLKELNIPYIEIEKGETNKAVEIIMKILEANNLSLYHNGYKG